MTDFDDRMKLSSIISNYFFGRNSDVAYVLQEMGIKASVRTIQAWRMPPNSKSSRKIPPGVINKLEDYIKDPQNKTKLGALNLSIDIYSNENLYSEYLYDQKLVESAERNIKCDENIKSKWINSSLSNIPQLLYDLEKNLKREILSFIRRNQTFDEAMRKSDDFQSFKMNYEAISNTNFNIDSGIRDTQKDIEDNSKEFLDSHGLLLDSDQE